MVSEDGDESEEKDVISEDKASPPSTPERKKSLDSKGSRVGQKADRNSSLAPVTATVVHPTSPFPAIPQTSPSFQNLPTRKVFVLIDPRQGRCSRFLVLHVNPVRLFPPLSQHAVLAIVSCFSLRCLIKGTHVAINRGPSQRSMQK